MSETTCIWTGSETPRAIRNRHVEDCEDDSCRGCLPCPGPHCIVCGRVHVTTAATEPAPESISSPSLGDSFTEQNLRPQNGAQQTCPGCVGDARTNLRDIRDLARALPGQASNDSRDRRPEDDHVMGGDAMAAMVSDTTRGAYLPHDPIGPLAFLATWEDDWRHVFKHGPAGRATVDDAIAYLDKHLSMAAQRHPAFDEFAAELPRIVASLERILHDGNPDDTTAAACFRCNGQLVRKVNPLLAPAEGRKGFDSEGRSDSYECRRCGQSYDEAEYWLAVKKAYEEAADGGMGNTA